MKLIEIGENGELPKDVPVNEFLQEVADEVVAHYKRIAFVPPWLCFVGLKDGVPVAVGGYKSQPVEHRVEIAYGAVPPLPFEDETFSLVFTRYSFHHFADPLAVLKETNNAGRKISHERRH